MTFFEHLLLCINSAANRLTSKGTRKKEKSRKRNKVGEKRKKKDY